MFTTLSAFEAAWANESQATQRVLDALTDASLSQRIAPEHRSLGQLAWHLATTIPEMMSRTGLPLTVPAGGGEHAPAPTSAAAIAAAYREQSDKLLAALRANWTDATLLQTSDMYGETWPNGLTLNVLLLHEVHHRGQMTVLLRQAGLRTPKIYGPAREDWIEMGLQPHA
ncbi:DinB family protein [Paenibacillus sp. TRM 82003]|nr:DinB family protein [Paenibacillus sp. TRM 82003]